MISIVDSVLNANSALANAATLVRARSHCNMQQIVIAAGSRDGNFDEIPGNADVINYWVLGATLCSRELSIKFDAERSLHFRLRCMR